MADEKTAPIKLLRDTWLGVDRVAADGKTIQWPVMDARRLIESGVAVRMDPLPGE